MVDEETGGGRDIGVDDKEYTGKKQVSKEEEEAKQCVPCVVGLGNGKWAIEDVAGMEGATPMGKSRKSGMKATR